MFGEFILLFYSLDEVLNTFLTCVFYSKIVNNKGKGNKVGAYFHGLGVCLHSKYPCWARHFLKSLLASMPA